MQFVFVRWLLCLWVVIGLSSNAGTARAESRKKVQVVAIMSEDAYEQAQALTVALKSALEKDKRWDLRSGDFSLEVMVTALSCPAPPNSECLEKIAAKIESDRFFWGTMKKDGENVVANLRFWNQGRTGSQTTLRYSANLSDAADEKLLELARGALREMVGSPIGTLVVLAAAPNGEIWIGGRRAGALRGGRAQLTLPEGDHEVALRAPGYEDASSTVTIASGEEYELTLEPVRRDEESEEAAADTPGEGAGTQRTVGWVALGAGGVLAAGGVYSMLRVASISEDPAFENYRNRLRSDQDACEEADRGTRVPGASSPQDVADQCSTADTFEVLQYVFFGLAAASAGTGAILLLTDSGESRREQHAISLRPRFRPSSKSTQLDLAIAF